MIHQAPRLLPGHFQEPTEGSDVADQRLLPDLLFQVSLDVGTQVGFLVLLDSLPSNRRKAAEKQGLLEGGWAVFLDHQRIEVERHDAAGQQVGLATPAKLASRRT